MRKETVAGIDVSKDVLDVAVRRDEQRLETARFDNDVGGHRKLVAWLTKRGCTARVVLESTGTYSLDVALALHRARGIAVMVANPRAVKQFAGALMQRSKTDLTAAAALREYAARMPFVVWQPLPPKCWRCVGLLGGSRRSSSSAPGNATGSMRCGRLQSSWRSSSTTSR
jgi:transposase